MAAPPCPPRRQLHAPERGPGACAETVEQGEWGDGSEGAAMSRVVGGVPSAPRAGVTHSVEIPPGRPGEPLPEMGTPW